jgi:hypothetical protein
LPDHLVNWFEHLDTTPSVRTTIRRLQNDLDFKGWYEKQLATVRSMAGSGKLDFGTDKEKSLGMRLLLFREFAEKRMEVYQFAHRFVYSRGDINDLTRGVVEQLFEPLARELRRLLESNAEVADRDPVPLPFAVPASDREVTLDHNTASYAEAVEALDRLEQLLRETNDYDDTVEKEQRRAEVSAVRRLFDASRIRVEPVVTLLQPLIAKFTAENLKATLVGVAVAAVLTSLAAILGRVAGLY